MFFVSDYDKFDFKRRIVSCKFHRHYGLVVQLFEPFLLQWDEYFMILRIISELISFKKITLYILKKSSGTYLYSPIYFEREWKNSEYYWL